jgi:hypothetical protein
VAKSPGMRLGWSRGPKRRGTGAQTPPAARRAARDRIVLEARDATGRTAGRR